MSSILILINSFLMLFILWEKACDLLLKRINRPSAMDRLVDKQRRKAEYENKRYPGRWVVPFDEGLLHYHKLPSLRKTLKILWEKRKD